MIDALKCGPKEVSQRRRAVWLALGMSALAGAGGFLWWTKDSSMPAETGKDKHCESRPAPRIGGAANELTRYALEYAADLCDRADCTTLLELKAELEAHARPSAPGLDSVVELRVLSKATRGDLELKLPSSDALATPIAVTLSRQGRIADLRYARQVDHSTARLLETLVRELQVQTPGCDDDLGNYGAVENLVDADVVSRFEADARAREIRWKRQRVLLWKDDETLFPIQGRSPEIAASDHSVRFTSQGFIETLSGHDEFVLQMGADSPEMRLKTRISVAPLQSVAAQAQKPPGWASNTFVFTRPAQHSELADSARIAGHDVKTLTQELRRTKVVKGDQGPTRSRLFVSATALFRRNPAAAKEAVALIRDKHPERQFLASALGDAGTSENAELLADLLDGSQDLRALALGALGRARSAPASVVDAMVKQFADPKLSGTALLMTGALARGVRESSPETSAKAEAALVQAYDTSNQVLRRADALRGLGNAGSMRGLAVAERAASSKNALERSAAAQALRRIPSDAADRILSTLVGDSDAFVRRSALDAALYRDPTELLAPSVLRVARLDHESTVRREAIRVLVRWKDDVPSVRQTLIAIASSDPEQDLRKVAAEGLQRFNH